MSPVRNFICALDTVTNNHFSYISALLREHGRPELKVQKLQDLELQDLQLKNIHPHKLFHQIEFREPLQPERSEEN